MIIDKSLHFGQQNFFFVQTETSGSYDYVGYQNRKGVILIARYNIDGSDGRYCVKTGAFAAIWALKADPSYIYTYPVDLVDPLV